MPRWLAPESHRSLEAVWDEIPDEGGIDRLATLQLVAERLFTGYSVTVSASEREPIVRFSPLSPPVWRVSWDVPELRSPVGSWFERDVRGLDEEVEGLIHSLPVEALSWADSALKRGIAELLAGRLPGWSFALQVRLTDSGGTLHLTFRPEPPLVLALAPSLYSSTLPVMLQSDLAAKLAPGLSAVVGLPVGWMTRHRADVEALAREFLEDRNAVSNVRAKVEVAFVPGQVAKVSASVNSDRLLFQVWLAATAGIRGRYPELGVLLGWNTRHLTGVDLELYGEALVELDDFSLRSRLGARFLLFGEFRIGAELEWPGQNLFYRLQWDAYRLRRPYVWWRWGPDWGHEAALGYRFNEHVSVEVYYEYSDEGKVGLRGILSL